MAYYGPHYYHLVPFTQKATILRYVEEEIPTAKIMPPPVRDEVAIENAKQKLSLYPSFFIGLYKLNPMDIYVPQKDTFSMSALIWAIKETMEKVPAQVRVIDYRSVAFAIQIFEVRDPRNAKPIRRATYPDGEGYIEQSVMNGSYIGAAKSGVTPKFSHDITTLDFSKTSGLRRNAQDFSDVDDIDIPPDLAPETAQELTADMIKQKVMDYFDSENPIQPLLLLGSTAVAKSALVKDITSARNWRLVDLRSAFLDRLDVRGLGRIIDVPDDKVMPYAYTTAPAKWAVECSDDFLEHAEKMYGMLEEKLAALNPDDPQRAIKESVINEWLAYFGDKKRTPVLFFDEITRAPGFIINTLFTIFSNKFVEGGKGEQLKMTRAKIICAANAPTAGEPDAYKDVMYLQGDAVEDVAFLDRFNFIEVSPKAVEDRWREWANRTEKEGGTRTNIHPLVMGFLTDNDHYIYHPPPEQEGRDPQWYVLQPFPNYRTWEFVSRMCDSGFFYEDQIAKTVGAAAARDLNAWLNKNKDKFIYTKKLEKKQVPPYPMVKKVTLTDASNYIAKFKDPATGEVKSEERSGDPMRGAIQMAAKTNVPLMLVAPTGIGKTTRLLELAREPEHNAELITVALSRFDRAEILGAPKAMGTYDALTSSARAALGNDPLVDEISALLEGVTLGTVVNVTETSAVVDLVESVRVFDDVHVAGSVDYRLVMDEIITDSGTVKEAGAGDTLYLSFPAGKVPSVGDRLIKVTTGSSEVTDFVPWALKAKIDRARKQGKKVWLFFDELNRAPDEVKSAVFEAISDCRFAGVKWCENNCPCSEVQIFAAANYGEKYSNASELDPAFAARFTMYVQTKYTEQDLQAFVEYAELNNWHPAIPRFFRKLMEKGEDGIKKAINYLAQSEELALGENKPSPRTWNQLSVDMWTKHKNGSLSGYPLFDEPKNRTSFRAALDRYDGNPSPDLDRIFQFDVNRWLPSGANRMIELFKGKRVSAEEIFKAWKLAYSRGDIKKVRYFGDLMQTIDLNANEDRIEAIRTTIGTNVGAEIIKEYDKWQKEQEQEKVIDLKFTGKSLDLPPADLAKILEASIEEEAAAGRAAEMEEVLTQLCNQCSSFSPNPQQSANYMDALLLVLKQRGITETLQTSIENSCLPGGESLYNIIAKATGNKGFSEKFYSALLGAEAPEVLAEVKRSEEDASKYREMTGLDLFGFIE